MKDLTKQIAGIEAQAAYCKELAERKKSNGDKDFMIAYFEKGEGFAPKDGHCYACHRNIYLDYDRVTFGGITTRSKGISTEEARTSLITGCPHCHRCYCD